MGSAIRYYGWPGKNNIGDEAIYLANRRLFNEFELVGYNSVDEECVPAGLFGGGTTMPATRWNLNDLPASGPYAAIGVGVKDPIFWNRELFPIDVGYHLGRLGIGEITRSKYVDYATKPLLYAVDSVSIIDHYINNSDFDPLSDFTHVGVRGPRSKQVLDNHGVSSKIVGDTSLMLEPSEYHPEETNRIAVVLRSEGEKWQQDNSYQDIVLEFCQDYSDDYEFVFLPFFPPDIPLHMNGAKIVNNASFSDYCTQADVESALDELSNCDLVIGEKLHANVLSACAHTPFLSLEYQPKNDDFARSIDMEEYNVRTNRLTYEWLESRFHETITSDELRNQLADHVDKKRSKLTEFSEDIIKKIP